MSGAANPNTVNEIRSRRLPPKARSTACAARALKKSQKPQAKRPGRAVERPGRSGNQRCVGNGFILAGGDAKGRHKEEYCTARCSTGKTDRGSLTAEGEGYRLGFGTSRQTPGS